MGFSVVVHLLQAVAIEGDMVHVEGAFNGSFHRGLGGGLGVQGSAIYHYY